MIDRLRDALLAADYTTDAVLDRLTEAGQDGLGRNCTVPAETVLAGADDPQSTLIRLWLLQLGVSRRAAERALPLDELVGAGYLRAEGDRIHAAFDVRPYGSPDDGASGWVVSDLQPGLNGAPSPMRPDYVLGVSPASTTLAQLVDRRQVDRALDLGTGCGVQALHLAQHTKRVVATDVNPRALALARLTWHLSQVKVDWREGSLFEPTPDKFDLIVSNPPFVMSPPEGTRLTYRETSMSGDSLVEHLVRNCAERLNPGGSLQLLTNWALTDQDWQERLAGWVPAGCNAWFIERERLDVYAYIEMWLADAGLAGTPGWRAAYDEWLAYFDQLGITGIGMGWVQVTKAERDQPSIVCESWPHAVAQPVGDTFANRRSAIDLATAATDDLLGMRLALAPDVQQETLGEPGAADPEFIVLRQRTGLCRAIKVDTAAAAVLGACDGELTVGQIIDAVSHLLESDVTEAVLPVLRSALGEGMLQSAIR